MKPIHLDRYVRRKTIGESCKRHIRGVVQVSCQFDIQNLVAPMRQHVTTRQLNLLSNHFHHGEWEFPYQ